VALTAACGGAARPAAEPAPTPPATAELEAVYRARRDSARMAFTAADVRFMTDMIAHHGQALVMAGLAPTHGASPGVRTLAARIVNAQRDEIAAMQRWLGDRGQPVPEAHAGGHHARHMPGMLTDDQLRELDRARDAAFDRAFLTFMIQHHGGAVTMVDALFATDGAAQDDAVFKLASDIQVDQRTEIARMRIMLDTMPTAERGR